MDSEAIAAVTPMIEELESSWMTQIASLSLNLTA